MRAIVRHRSQIQKVKASNPFGPGGHARFVAAELPLLAGSWVILAKADVKNVSSPSQQLEIRSFLIVVGADAVEDRSDATVPNVEVRHTINLMVGANVPILW